jgi:cereblon
MQVELRGTGGEAPDTDHQSDDASDTDPSRGASLRCAACHSRIAHSASLICVNGEAGPSVYVNPHGRVFAILTLREAENLLGVGASTTDHTWFSGYAWQIVCCATCSTHLGWRFTGDGDPRSFYGIIRSEVVEEAGRE